MLISVEGIDGAGKRTLSLELKQQLERAGQSCSVESYPRYSNVPFGRLIGSALRDDEVPWHDPSALCLAFALDRWDSWPYLRGSADVIIVDRWSASNVAYGGARNPDRDLRHFAGQIADLEHGTLGLPAPDLTVLLETSPELGARRRQSRTSTDHFETNEVLQYRALENYRVLSTESWMGEWLILDHSLESPAELAARVLSHLRGAGHSDQQAL